ncbi:integumentary mucin C.1-like [Episyrphus balteatus]|uniref:integumentary mucin C.1-like n=1 Tax=Episyrphus balteatus TaxID=286459 RepID=UPI002485BA2B|nr:integumentary mucin C.1-like [Episyrphus balteatus]
MLSFQILQISIGILLVFGLSQITAQGPFFHHKWRGNRTTMAQEYDYITTTTLAPTTTSTTTTTDDTTTSWRTTTTYGTTTTSPTTAPNTDPPCLTDLCKKDIKAKKGLFVINFM